MLAELVEVGLGNIFQLPIVGKLAGKASGKAIKLLKAHFTDSSHELVNVFQKSYVKATLAIAMGMTSQEQKVWKNLLVIAKKAGQSKVANEFSQAINDHYFLPFSQDQGLSQEERSHFQDKIIKLCSAFSKAEKEVLPFEFFEEPDWVSLLNNSHSSDISFILLENMKRIGKIEGLEESFLSYGGLLGDAVLHFFKEGMRKNPRVEVTLAALQREGLWVDVQDIKVAQMEMKQALESRLSEISRQLTEAQQGGDFAKLAELAPIAHSLQEQMGTISTTLEDAKVAWEGYGKRLEIFETRFGEWCNLISSNVDEIRSGIESLQENMQVVISVNRETQDKVDILSDQVEALLDMMHQMQISPQIKARDEFSQHNTQSLELIHKAVHDLKKLPRSKAGYSVAAIAVGSALSSSGNIKKSIEILQEALTSAQNTAEKALASFNLFQVYLRENNHENSLKSLQMAINLDPEKYALHDYRKYSIERILGAGGMGCAFLCNDRLRGKVVVKTFWDARQGPIDEVFSEVLMMVKIAGRYVPQPFDYGYVLPQQEKRPFIVMEYVENAIDGEDWIKKYGAMNLEEGLQVGIELAKGLAIAHQAGICHLDLKPANLLLKRENNEIIIKIIDFGLSRVATSLKTEAATNSRSGKSLFAQEIFGTLDYAPPEQLGEIQYGTPDFRSDLFSFGATLYRLMSGENPRTINPLCLPDNQELFKLLAQCLMYSPDARPNSALEVISHLENVQKTASQTPTSRFIDLLKEDLPPHSILESDDESELFGEGRALGLSRKEVREIFRSFLQEHNIQRRSDVVVIEQNNTIETDFSTLIENAFGIKDLQLNEQNHTQSENSTQEEISMEEHIKNAFFNDKVLLIENHNKIIARYRPTWLPTRIERETPNWTHTDLTEGGCLPPLPPLSSQVQRKVILAKDDSFLMEVIKIPEGYFLMGSADDPLADSNEMPQQQVYLDDYWIGRTPITNYMWLKFLQESHYQATDEDNDGDYLTHWLNGEMPHDQLHTPVVNVSYLHVWAFCDFYGLMLPSEAQWEKSARGDDGRIFPWGNQEPTLQHANLNTLGVSNIGDYLLGASPYSLLDCAGNVYEWCADHWEEDLLQNMNTNERNPRAFCNEDVNDYACRGGNYFFEAQHARCASRNSYESKNCSFDVGFRIALP